MRRAVAALLVVLAAAGCGREPTQVSIGVAASLRNVMPELVERYRATSGTRIEVVYGASGVLAEQVTRGAALDGVVLAEAAALDGLVEAGAIAADSRRTVATSAIVLIGPPSPGLGFAGLASLPAGAKIAIGDPATVPVGRYARRYLEQIGAWEAVQPRLIFGGDVAAVLALAVRGDARVAIVYRTDARLAAPLVVLDEPTDGPVVTVVAGVVEGSRHRSELRGFLDFLASPDGQAILTRYGFTCTPP